MVRDFIVSTFIHFVVTVVYTRKRLYESKPKYMYYKCEIADLIAITEGSYENVFYVILVCYLLYKL